MNHPQLENLSPAIHLRGQFLAAFFILLACLILPGCGSHEPKKEKITVDPITARQHAINAFTAAAAGQSKPASAEAEAFHRKLDESAPDPTIEGYQSTPALVALRDGLWDDVLVQTDPGDDHPMAAALYHFARGMAYAQKGKIREAQSEQQDLEGWRFRISHLTMFGTNNADDVIAVAQSLLAGKLLAVQGDARAAEKAYETAVQQQSTFVADGPLAFPFSAAEYLGADLLALDRPADAQRVFAAASAKDPGNARLLFGLWKSQEALGQTIAAQATQAQFTARWQQADFQLDLANF